MNSVHIIGRLTKNPVLRKTKNGRDILRFVIKIERKIMKASEGANDNPAVVPDYIPCFASDSKAVAIADNMEEGHRIGITGHLQSYMRLDKSNMEHYQVEVYVDTYDFLTPRKPKYLVVP